MDIWDELKKLTGYQSGNGGVDSYGVDHSGFSTRDELEYQNARLNRENQLADNFSKQGIAEENYPQFGTNFWGGSPENNYGFGTSNIKQNIENVTNRLNNSGVDNGANNGQVFANNNVSSYPNAEKTAYNQFVQSDAYNQLRDFQILQDGYKRTIDNGGMVFPYPDINGDITGCIGHNMKNDFNKHPWISVKTGQPMNSSQISSEEEALLNIQRNLKPELFATKTDARLPQEYCENLYNQDIKNRWQTLSKAIPNWQQMSPEIQAATMDVHYTGNMEPENKWTIAKGAAQKMKKDDYCDNLHRDDTNRRDIIARNKWVRDMCLRGKFYK